MKAVCSIDSAKKLDRYLIDKYSLSESALIDGAAKGAYRLIRDKLLNKKVLFAIGKGNNGSDGLEMARLLSRENNNVALLFLLDSANEENLKRRERVSFLDRVFDVNGYDIIIDCLFGFGFHSTLDDETLDLITRINQSGSYVIALDIPSGMKIIANMTIAITTPKLEFFHPLFRSQIGILKIVNPGFPENELSTSPDSVYLLEDDDLNVRPFSISDYKNTRGHICVLGGSDKFPGAPILAIRSAIKSGAGLATLVSTQSVLDLAYSHYPSIILTKASNVNFSRYSSIVVGPGWDSGDERLLDLALDSGIPMVIDADGIKLLKNKKLNNRGIITPHLGEYRTLCKLLSVDDGLTLTSSLTSSLLNVARILECVVVLKSSTIWITDGNSIYIYDGHNPSLGVAGSGDVLAGIIGALLSSGGNTLNAAINGVIMHQKAGKRAHNKFGFYMAEELIGEIERP